MADVTFTSTSVKQTSGPTPDVLVLGEAATAGDTAFKDADEKLYKADNTDGTKPDEGEDLGVILADGAAGQSVPFARKEGTKIDFGAGTFVQGRWYVVSANGGKIAPESDLASTNHSDLLGYAETDAVLVLMPKRTGVAVA